VHNVASVLGIAGGFGALGAVLFNYYVGQMIGKLGAGSIFMIMAVLHPLAALLLWAMVKREKVKSEGSISKGTHPELINTLN
jgi:MFS transporter, ACS family, hexuronate transporter